MRRMNLYNIVGLTRSTFIGNSYATDVDDRISRDESGKVIAKPTIFAKYVLYIAFENAYYAIHLSEQHCASGGGRLCCCGNMEITPSRYAPAITHLPKTPLVVIAAFDVKAYDDFGDDVRVCVNEDPDTCVFEFSLMGNNEVRPCGFVRVNMDLFIDA